MCHYVCYIAGRITRCIPTVCRLSVCPSFCPYVDFAREQQAVESTNRRNVVHATSHPMTRFQVEITRSLMVRQEMHHN